MYSPKFIFRDRVSFTEPLLVDDGRGGTKRSGTTTVLNANAKVEPLTSSRQLEANQENINQGYQVTIWERQGFTPSKSMQVVYRGQSMTIISIVRKFEARWYYEIRCVDGEGAD